MTPPEEKIYIKEIEVLLKLYLAPELFALSKSTTWQKYLGPDDVLIALNVWHGVEVTFLHGAVRV